MRRLQSFSFKQSTYERPNQTWVCGRSAVGQPCPAGPDARGICQATCECTPVRKGDRWVCTRHAAFGGPCMPGPLPDGQCARHIPKCTPVRSLRSKRFLTVLLVTATTAGALLLALGTKSGRRFLSPGELSFQHSSIGSQCSDCHAHAGAQMAPIEWLAGAATSPAEDGGRLCLKCHDLGAHPFDPHGTGLGSLRKARAAHPATSASTPPVRIALAGLIAGNPLDRSEALSCATCHREHQGKEHTLTKLSDQQCQSCHSVQFASFSQGHPPFQNYPFRRRTRLNFDHVLHYRQHFTEERVAASAPQNCAACHEQDAKGHQMLVKPFALTCAACHQEQIKGKGRAGSPGVAVLRLPGLDVPAFEDKNIFIGDWPEFAEGTLTPFMRILLSGDPETRAALDRLDGVDLVNLAKANDARLNDAARLAWVVKELFFDLTAKGHAAIEQRLLAADKRYTSAQPIEHLAGLLSLDVIQAARTAWFPNLTADLELHRAGKKPATPRARPPSAAAKSEKTAASVKTEDWALHGGWFRSDADYSISYRPEGHADAFLHSWLDVSSRAHAAAPLFELLADAKAPGVCMKCHSVDEKPVLHVNWKPAAPHADEHPATRFSHVSHFSLLGTEGCFTCHDLDRAAPADAFASAFEKNRDPEKFHSNFKPLRQQVCARCHTAQSAGDSCLSCHNYHVGRFSGTLPPPWGLKTQPSTAAPAKPAPAK